LLENNRRRLALFHVEREQSMRSALIGHTGFIGGNLARQFPFTDVFHSKTISSIRDREFELLVCSGVTAMKWWANQNAAEDRQRICSLLSDLSTVRASRVVLLSTVDVYPVSSGVDESFDCDAAPNHAYGTNRRFFEKEICSLFDNVQIVRIGGVFGPGLKKNVIYDLLNDNCLDRINPDSAFQYYNVAHLWRDIERMGNEIRLVNFVTQPIATGCIIHRLFPGITVGADAMPTARYDVRTLHSAAFSGPDGYLASAAQVISELSEFVNARRGREAA